MAFIDHTLKLFILLAKVIAILSEAPNSTLFPFIHPYNCKQNEYYDLDYFSCSACDAEGNLHPSFDKLNCECKTNSSIVAYYDSLLQRQICSKPCINYKNNKCQTQKNNDCNIKFVNYTTSNKYIRITPFSELLNQSCVCERKYNFQFRDYCIWGDLLKAYTKYDVFSQMSYFYSDLKTIAFFCQSLQKKTACNQLANFCVHSFFDIGKNSPCSIFLLTQATDAALYTNVPIELRNLRPFLFYRKGKDTVQVLKQSFPYSLHSKTENTGENLQLFSTTYSFNGQLERWGPFRPDHVNLCSPYVHDVDTADFFRQLKISCKISMENIINMASHFADKNFISVFVNSTENSISTMQPVPVLIREAFEGNWESNTGEWQLVKRFQLIGAEKRPKSSKILPNTFHFEDNYKLGIYKFVRVLRKFELRLFFLHDKSLLMPLIILNYHNLNITTNISLSQMYTFDLIVKHESAESFGLFYKIGLPIFLTIAFVLTFFKTYLFKIHRNLRYCDIIVVLQCLLYIMSYVGNAFLFTVVLDAFYSIIIINTKAHERPMIGQYDVHIFQTLVYFTVFLKGFNFIINSWQIAKVDVFFVDWEKPKGGDGSVHFKNNLESSSQCSNLMENNVSAWRIFFIANEWVSLCGKQRISNFLHVICTLSIYWITKNTFFYHSYNTVVELFLCIVTSIIVYVVQCLIKSFLLDKILGSPLQKFMDTCTMANISIIAFLNPSFGFYIHGRSPHGFSDTDINSMIWQLQRESQNMCGKRGLLTDSDYQTYIMLPPLKLKQQAGKLLPRRQATYKCMQNYDENFDRNTNVYNRINRFFCAFIDHAIKDLDYIIKEKSFIEEILGCEFSSYTSEHQGVFYIDKALTFSSLFLYGNYKSIFMTELSLLIALVVLIENVTISLIVVCILNKIFEEIFRHWVRTNIALKTSVDKRFLM